MKAFDQMRTENQGLRAAHKKIKDQRDEAHRLLEKVLVFIDKTDPREQSFSYDLEQEIIKLMEQFR